MPATRLAVAIMGLGIISGCGRAEPIHVLVGHRNYVRTLAFSPDGSMLAAGDSNGGLKVWDVRAGAVLRELEPGVKSNDDVGQIDSVQFSPDGKVLASSWDGVSLWDTATGKRLHHLEGHHAEVTCVAFSPDGKTLASGSPDKTIKLWVVESGKEISTLSGHPDGVLSVAFSPDGATLASGDRVGSIIIWDVRSGTAGTKIKGPPAEPRIMALAFLSGGTILASQNGFGMLQLWDVAKGVWLRNVKTDRFEVLSFSSDGKTAAMALNFGEETTLRLLSVTNGEEHKEVVHWNSPANSVAASPDGSLIALGTYDSRITLWKIRK
jgi:WD40 repeat protein